MKKRESQVPVQKGPIKLNNPTYKWVNQDERLRERDEQLKGIKYGQTLELHTPKK